MDVNLLPDDLKKAEAAERERIAHDGGTVLMSEPLAGGKGVPGKSLEAIASRPHPMNEPKSDESPRVREHSYIQPGPGYVGQAASPVPSGVPQTLPTRSSLAPKPSRFSLAKFFHRSTPVVVATTPTALPKLVAPAPSPAAHKPVARPAVVSVIASSLKTPMPLVIPKVPAPIGRPRLTTLPGTVVMEGLTHHQREWLGVVVALTVIGLLGILAAPFAAGKVTMMRMAWQQEKEAIVVDLNALASTEQEWQTMARRAPWVSMLLSNHRSLNKSFGVIEATVLPTVQYGSATITADGKMHLTGQAVNEIDVSRQVAALRIAPEVLDARMQTLTVTTPAGNAFFTLLVTLRPEFLRYADTR